MKEDLVNFIIGTFGATSYIIGGLALLLINPIRKWEVRYYMYARYLLALAYFTIAGSTIYTTFFSADLSIDSICSFYVVANALLQCALFTYSFLALLKIPFHKSRKHLFFFLSIMIVFAFIMLLNLIFAGNGKMQPILFLLLSCIYVVLLLVYAVIFFYYYYRYRTLLTKLPKGAEEEKQTRWVFYSFILVLLLGMAVLYISIVQHQLIYNVFTVVCSVFYLLFAGKYINHSASYIRLTRMPVATLETLPAGKINTEFFDNYFSEWIRTKGFLNSGVTIESLSKELGTNRSYLSSYINKRYQTNFNTWINKLRIEESKQMMMEERSPLLSEVANNVGLTDLAHYSRLFKRFEGVSPSEWKRGNCQN